MKLNLKDVTFLIPVKIDSVIRIENLLATIRNITCHFNTNVIVIEVARYNNRVLPKLLNRKIQYIFEDDNDPIFYRTKYLNLIANKIKTTFLAVWDADIIIDKNQIKDSVVKLRDENLDIVYPYDGRFYDTSPIIRELFLRRKKNSLLHKNISRMSLPYGNHHKGGAFIANTESYKKAGMENVNFYGWGPEDFERFERWKNMNYKIYFTPGALYHLTHPRDINGKFNSKFQMNAANTTLIQTRNSSKEEILHLL